MQVVLVDPENKQTTEIANMLSQAGIELQFMNKPDGVLAWSVENKPDAIIAPLQMDPVDGISLCKEFRDHPMTSEIIFILSDENDDNYVRTLSLNAGADAFLKKPFDSGLLKATLQAMKRRIVPLVNEVPRDNEPVILLEKHVVMYRGREIMLPRKEFEIFVLLYYNRGNVLTRETIIRKVWKDKMSRVNPRTIDVHIRKLREQIGERFIHTIKGVGYKYKPS